MKLKEEELSNLDGIENFWVDQWNRYCDGPPRAELLHHVG
jgi:hypothetical protein